MAWFKSDNWLVFNGHSDGETAYPALRALSANGCFDHVLSDLSTSKVGLKSNSQPYWEKGKYKHDFQFCQTGVLTS